MSAASLIAPSVEPDTAHDSASRLTKIVATIGPATNTPAALLELHAAGINMARLNLSHNDLDWHGATITMLREILPDVPILLDIPGRKIRTIQLAHEPSFAAGDIIVLTTDPDHDGTDKVPVNYDKLHADLETGATILADDGTLRFEVVRIDGPDIHCRAQAAGQLKSRKGINVPYVSLGTRLLTDVDRKMIDFAREQGVDFIGISFVESAVHVQGIRALIGDSWPRIIAKIENQGGLDNMEEIIQASDVIMIDRGDLSVETNLENLAVMQKQIIEMARHDAKPVIVATEMLHTMINGPIPTKAEVTDIANAVFDGCAATMLSGETAIGANPFEAVGVMRRVIESTESHLLERRKLDRQSSDTTIPEAVGAAIGQICKTLPITKIVAVTIGGYSAQMVSAQRTGLPIYAISNDEMAARSFNLMSGTRGIHTKIEFSRTSTDHIVKCLKELWERGDLVDDDMVLVTSVGYPNSGNRMNLIETHLVSDLKRAMGWED